MAIDFGKVTPGFLSLFGESISYVKAGGTTRAIVAVVDRQPITSIPETPAALRPHMLVYVANSATTGISLAELDCGTDLLRFAARVGGTAEDITLTRIYSQDAAMLCLECR